MLVICKLETRNFVNRVSVDYYLLRGKPPLSDEHAFPPTGVCCGLARLTLIVSMPFYKRHLHVLVCHT